MSKQSEFISKIAPLVQKYAPNYGVTVCSPIISQAILESGWGTSTLGAKYHNYFGMKAGVGRWKGPTVNMQTQEEYSVGTLTTISDNFRVYSSMEEGVQGYFEFLFSGISRYDNLRGISDPWTYLNTIKQDGYATDSQYVNKNMRIINDYNLKQYDALSSPTATKGGNAMSVIQKVIDIAATQIGYLEKRTNQQLDSKTANAGNNNYTKYWRDIYPQYQGSAWCAAFISWCFMKAYGLQAAKKMLKHWPFVYCPTMASLFNLKTKPDVGDVVLFWRNGEYAHTGLVVGVSGDLFTTIEGNTSGASGVIANGGGVCKKTYNIYNVTAKFCQLDYSLAGEHQTPSSTGTSYSGPDVSHEKRYSAIVTASELNIRWDCADTGKLCSFSPLKKGTKVQVCDEVTNTSGEKWCFIKYKDLYGFAISDYLQEDDLADSSYIIKGADKFDPKITGEYRLTKIAAFRRGPGTEYEIMENIPKGNIIQCYGYYAYSAELKKWLYVVYNGKTGFVTKSKLQKV